MKDVDMFIQECRYVNIVSFECLGVTAQCSDFIRRLVGYKGVSLYSDRLNRIHRRCAVQMRDRLEIEPRYVSGWGWQLDQAQKAKLWTMWKEKNEERLLP